MVGRDDSAAQPAGVSSRDRARAHVGAAPAVRDPGLVEMLERVEERLRPVVERVVVGERDSVDAELGEPLGRDGRRAEEERLAGLGPTFAAVGDTALEIENEEVGLRDNVADLSRATGGRGERTIARPTLRPSMVSPASASRTVARLTPCRGTIETPTRSASSTTARTSVTPSSSARSLWSVPSISSRRAGPAAAAAAERLIGRHDPVVGSVHDQGPNSHAGELLGQRVAVPEQRPRRQEGVVHAAQRGEVRERRPQHEPRGRMLDRELGHHGRAEALAEVQQPVKRQPDLVCKESQRGATVARASPDSVGRPRLPP